MNGTLGFVLRTSDTPPNIFEDHILASINDIRLSFNTLEARLKQALPTVFDDLHNFTHISNMDDYLASRILENDGPQATLCKKLAEMTRHYELIGGLTVHDLPTYEKDYRQQHLDRINHDIGYNLLYRDAMSRAMSSSRSIMENNEDLKPTTSWRDTYTGEDLDKFYGSQPQFQKYNSGYYQSKDNKFIIIVPFVTKSEYGDLPSLMFYHVENLDAFFYIRHPLEKMWVRDNNRRHVDLVSAAAATKLFVDGLPIDRKVPFETRDELINIFLGKIDSYCSRSEFFNLVEKHQGESNPTFKITEIEKPYYTSRENWTPSYKLLFNASGLEIAHSLIKENDEFKLGELIHVVYREKANFHQNQISLGDHEFSRMGNPSKQLLVSRIKNIIGAFFESRLNPPDEVIDRVENDCKK